MKKGTILKDKNGNFYTFVGMKRTLGSNFYLTKIGNEKKVYRVFRQDRMLALLKLA